MTWGDIVKAFEMGQFDRLLVIPEFRRLLGVRQMSLYHHEDVWRHTALAIAGSMQLTDDPTVWWATACHDLGKGTGLLRHVGLHPNHGWRGSKIAAGLCKRLGLNVEPTRMAILAARYHEQLRKGHLMSEREAVDLLTKIGAVDNPARLTGLMQVVEADIMGRDARSLRKPPDAARESLQITLKCLSPSAV